MHVEVGDGFSAVGTVVDHDAVAVLTKSLLPRGGGGGGEECSKEGAIGRICFVETRNAALRDNKKMDGCLGSDVAKCDPCVSLSNDFSRDLACDDLLE